MMCLFNPAKSNFFASEMGLAFKDSALVNQVERAKNIPDRRRHDSNKCLPKEMWEE
jgi:hypothetical protein